MPKPQNKQLPAQVGKADYKRFFTQNKDWHWAYTVMIVGLFLGIFSLIFVGHRTMIGLLELSQILVGCCAVGMLLPWNLYRKWFQLERLEVFLLHLLGTGPILCALFLWLNFSIRTESQSRIVPIVEYEILQDELPRVSVLFHLRDSVLKDYLEYRRFDLNGRNNRLVRSEAIVLETAEGIFGYGLVLENRPIRMYEVQHP